MKIVELDNLFTTKRVVIDDFTGIAQFKRLNNDKVQIHISQNILGKRTTLYFDKVKDENYDTQDKKVHIIVPFGLYFILVYEKLNGVFESTEQL